MCNGEEEGGIAIDEGAVGDEAGGDEEGDVVVEDENEERVPRVARINLHCVVRHWQVSM